MNSHSLVQLRSRHRRALWLRPLWIVGLGLALALLAAALGAGPEAQLVLLGAVLALALGARVWPRRTVHDTARALDAQVGARNRFEAVAELGGRTDALAGALCSEADRYLIAHPLPRGRAWLSAVLSLAVLLPATLVLLGRGWVDAVRGPELVAARADDAPAKGQPPAARLRWITPAEDIAALASEALPLTAEAESNLGMRQVALHVLRNGEPLPPIAVPAEIAAGKQRVSTTLRLAELKLGAFDIVSYFLRAELNAAKDNAPKVAVSSPLQFVQILSEEDPRLAGACSNCSGGRILEIVRRLKREQLGIVRDTATLAHDTQGRSDPAWTKAVATVESRQTAIHEETAALLPTLAEAGVPNAAIEALLGAERETSTTATELSRIEPSSAVAPAGRAHARFAAAEKELAKNVIAINQRAPAEAPPTDLPPRESTPAGRLETLATQQAVVAEQIASRTALAGALTEQERLAREIARLAAERALPAGVNDQVKAAGDTAKEAERQLKAEDPVAATEPATRAAQTLADAAAALNAAGRARAADELLAAQRALIRTAMELHQAELARTPEAAKGAAERITAIRTEARTAAQRQQRLGSAEAARSLQDLAKAIGQSDVPADLAKLAEKRNPADDPKTHEQKEAAAEKILQLAQRAAEVAAGYEDTATAQARAVDELRRTQANLERERGRMPAAGTNASRDAAGIVGLYEDALRNAQRLAGVDSRDRGLPPPPGPGTSKAQLHEYAAALSLRLDGLLRIALAASVAEQRPQVLTFGNPAAAPPAYRAAVAEYFETLARDRATPRKP